jgi:predicted nuclease of predicted toxin-antitoxin system
MNFKIDENLPVEVAELLREAGHDALTVDEQMLSGSSDVDLAQVCKTEERILVTLDTDFADLRLYPPEKYTGLLVLRLGTQDKVHVLSVFRRILQVLKEESIKGHLWIVDKTRIRIR